MFIASTSLHWCVYWLISWWTNICPCARYRLCIFNSIMLFCVSYSLPYISFCCIINVLNSSLGNLIVDDRFKTSFLPRLFLFTIMSEAHSVAYSFISNLVVGHIRQSTTILIESVLMIGVLKLLTARSYALCWFLDL